MFGIHVTTNMIDDYQQKKWENHIYYGWFPWMKMSSAKYDNNDCGWPGDKVTLNETAQSKQLSFLM